MVKSGLIAAAVMLVVSVGITLLFPICSPCLAIFFGVGAGYLACVFDKPIDNSQSAKAGAIAGAIGGGGSVVGQLIGGVLNAVIVGPEQAADLLEQFGLEGPVGGPTYYLSAIGTPVCIGLLNVALMAGLGALGGILWWQMSGKNRSQAPEEGMVEGVSSEEWE